MKIKKGFKLKNISGRQTVVADRRTVKDFNSHIILNESAVILWEMLASGEYTKEELTAQLNENMKISKTQALGNVKVFIKTLMDNGILEDWNIFWRWQASIQEKNRENERYREISKNKLKFRKLSVDISKLVWYYIQADY